MQTQQTERSNETPAVVAARARLAPLREHRERLEAERDAAWRVGGYTNTFSDTPPTHASDVEVLHARVRLKTVDVDLLAAMAAEAPAARALASAEQDARRERLAGIDARRAPKVKALAVALAQAAAVNAELAALDEEATGVGGNFVVRCAWHELLAPSPAQDTRLDAWRRSMREHGLLR